MNLENEILREHSKRQVVKIAEWIGNDKRRFGQLMNLFLHGDYRTAQRSAWVVSCCGERHPQLVTPWLKAMIDRMQESGVHIAVKRNVFRILECIDIPESLLGTVVSACTRELESVDSAIAVKAYSMTILLNVAQKEPVLKHELQALIEQSLPNAGAGIRARATRVLNTLAGSRKKISGQHRLGAH
jgi:hypothetical protein